MKGMILSLLSLASLAFGSCFGASVGCYACDNCEEDHADGVCDFCGKNGEAYGVQQYTESLELCVGCVNENYGDDYGCEDCMGCF